LALIFSPLSEDTLLTAPRTLFPGSAFIMRQIGNPPALDEAMAAVVREVFDARGIGMKDADASTGAKDFLERILGLIRGTGFTVAIFSEDTRGTAMANIALELGFASMCGKPLVILKSKAAAAPSDLTRTDWIEYDPDNPPRFRAKLNQAVDELEEIANFTDLLLDQAMHAPAMDCAIAFERASKAFLLTREPRFLDSAEEIGQRLADLPRTVADLERVHDEITMFVRQGRRALRAVPHPNPGDPAPDG
jgi:hypothetical protein